VQNVKSLHFVSLSSAKRTLVCATMLLHHCHHHGSGTKQQQQSNSIDATATKEMTSAFCPTGGKTINLAAASAAASCSSGMWCWSRNHTCCCTAPPPQVDFFKISRVLCFYFKRAALPCNQETKTTINME